MPWFVNDCLRLILKCGIGIIKISEDISAFMKFYFKMLPEMNTRMHHVTLQMCSLEFRHEMTVDLFEFLKFLEGQEGRIYF